MKCQAYVSSTGNCCKKNAIKYSRYCWHHQSKISLLAASVIGIITGLVLPIYFEAIFPPKIMKDIRENTEPIPKMAEDIETMKEAFKDDKPDFDQNMWSVLTGIPAVIFKDYHKALDFFELEDYENAAKTIQSAISSYEQVNSWDLEEYSVKQHKEQVSNFYILASKANIRIGKLSIAYEYSKKALKTNETYYTYYSLSVSAYNLKNYQESLENINKAIDLTPFDSKYQKIREEYQQIKEKCLNHLELKIR